MIKKGNYTVKSGYQVALKIKCQEAPSCSNQKATQWSIIWTMALPKKNKIFIWRAARNLLPTEWKIDHLIGGGNVYTDLTLVVMP